MDYFCFIQSVVMYIENRVKIEVEPINLEKATGFSLAHIRDVFKNCTTMSLGRYILYRKVSNAAFEMVHTDKSILDIALEYGFETYDTFTRAFKRITGITPREFRKRRIPVGRIKLTGGMYGPGIIYDETTIHNLKLNLEEMNKMRTVKKSEDSCILYGVPKVQYCYEECTPFPAALKACLNYMGQEISYGYLMAVSGASFRLRWSTSYWDGGNVDIMCIYEDPIEAFERSFKAAGRSFQILGRKPEVNKQVFMDFIKAEIDEGRPVIALGIIGPPEACIITGYRDGGDTLLGWNFFQENPEFAKDSSIDESGYFICSTWWENSNTIGVMSIGEEKRTGTSLKEILQNAIDILTKEKIRCYAGGGAAFDAWISAISNESEFPKDAILPLLFERLMCQCDAMTMIGEGKAYAGHFIEWVGQQNERFKKQCDEIGALFKEESTLAHQMGKHIGGWQMGEEQARKLADPAVREEIVKLIREAKEIDRKACALLKKVVEEM